MKATIALVFSVLIFAVNAAQKEPFNYEIDALETSRIPDFPIGDPNQLREAKKFYNLGLKYGYVDGYFFDIKKASKYYLKADRLGHPQAKYELAKVFINFYGETPLSMKKVIGLLSEASEQGSAEAKAKLGIYYYKGKWVPKDELKAFNLVQSSASQGFPYGMYFIGFFYEEGVGTNVDYTKAQYWYEKCSKIKSTGTVQKKCTEASEVLSAIK